MNLKNKHKEKETSATSTVNTNSEIWDIDNLPNRLTIMRLVLIPVLLAILFISEIKFFKTYKTTFSIYATVLYFIASITDFFDGYLARKRNIVTIFGSFLDPIADKFLVVSLLIFFASTQKINAIIIIILVLREMYITSLRLMAHERDIIVPVSNLGKVKTTFQMLALGFLIIENGVIPFLPTELIGKTLLYLASFFSVYSATQYTQNLIIKLKIKINTKI